MRKLNIGLTILFALAVIGIAVPAQAASSSGQVTLQVTVPTSITFSFTTPNTINFGTVPAGTSAERVPGVAYEVATNNALGAHIDIFVDGGSCGGCFGIRKNEVGGAYTTLPGGSTISGWRTGIGTGTTAFTDDLNVTLAADQAGGTFDTVYHYIAITN